MLFVERVVMRLRLVQNCLAAIVSVAFAITVCSVSGCSSSSAYRGDMASSQGGATFDAMSPEQCSANAASFQGVSYEDRSYRIQRGDQLSIDFYLNPEFNDNAVVQPDGKINMKLVGPLNAVGMTPSQLADEIDTAYAKELRNPGATVHVQQMPSRLIFVQGQVKNPGSFPLQPGETALQALASAGGITDTAQPKSVVLIRRDACGRAEGSKLDLASAIDSPGNGEDVLLMPHDTLVVPRSAVANVNLWVQQYIRGMLPVEPYVSAPIP